MLVKQKISKNHNPHFPFFFLGCYKHHQYPVTTEECWFLPGCRTWCRRAWCPTRAAGDDRSGRRVCGWCPKKLEDFGGFGWQKREAMKQNGPFFTHQKTIMKRNGRCVSPTKMMIQVEKIHNMKCVPQILSAKFHLIFRFQSPRIRLRGQETMCAMISRVRCTIWHSCAIIR